MFDNLIEKLKDAGYSAIGIFVLIGALGGLYAVICIVLWTSSLLVNHEYNNWGFSFLNDALMSIFDIKFGMIALIISIALLSLSRMAYKRLY
ncbi:hypothetical protein [Paenibacillus alvei]|uniref:hypothetical protein n=1 Tax=Paenibacillus alvei TaxID=44250 RepID=UPI00227FACE9|nr:hypothetical protein [Paenibacillus alvei]